MDDSLKKRLIGAAVLASLAVIFVPMLFEEAPPGPPAIPPLPGKPPVTDFASQMLRDTVPEVTPLAPEASAPKPTKPEKPAQTAAAEPRPAPKPAAPPPKPRPGLSAWVVQVGSFSSRENAEKLVARLRAADLPTPDPELVDVRGKRYYRVRVGPVVERARADGLVAQVSAVSGTQAKVQRYP